MSALDRFIHALFARHYRRGEIVSADSRRQFIRSIVLGGAAIPLIPGMVERIAP
jgi:hypothetical protein